MADSKIASLSALTKAQVASTDNWLVGDASDSDNAKKVVHSEFLKFITETKLDDFAAPDDNTDRDATTSAHGLMSKADKVKLDAITITDYVDKAAYNAHTILQATSDNAPAALTVGEATMVGRQTGGNITAIAQVSGGEITAGTETALRAFSPADVVAIVDEHAPGGSFDPASPGELGGTTPAAGTFTGLDVEANASDVVFYLSNLSGASDSKHWYFIAQSDALYWGLNNDAKNSGGNYVQITRSGTTPTAFNVLTGKMGVTGVIEATQVASGGTPASNSARIYSKDVAGTAEMFVMDEAGNETQISAHATNGPEHLYDSALDQVTYEAQYYVGFVRWTNQARARANRSDAVFLESFATFNARTGQTLTQLDWDTVQSGFAAQRAAEITAWEVRRDAFQPTEEVPTFTETAPAEFVAKPEPAFIAEQIAALPGLLAAQEAMNSRKVWRDASLFWAEFTSTEQLAILNSAIDGIRLLHSTLLMWRGEVWSDDPQGVTEAAPQGRVMAGLAGLVAVGILTEERKDEILTP